jgi:MoaA/NifB/PqqE/SkfB family radical SAM enzyme
MKRVYLHQALNYLTRSMPFELTVFVTSACNLRCAHCFYWERLNQKGELTGEEFERFAQSLPPLARITLSGGEPFLRKDLARVITALCGTARPAYLTIPTAGWHTERTVSVMHDVLRSTPDTFFNVSLSIDALGAERDRFVRREGSFDRLVDTARAVGAMRAHYPNLALTCITTMTRGNQGALEEIFRYAVDVLGVDNFALSAPHGSTAPDPGELDIDPERYRAMSERVAVWQRERAAAGSRVPLYDVFLANRDEVHHNTYRTMTTRQWFLPCQAGALRAVVLETGEVYSCEVQRRRGDDFLIGRLREHEMDFQRLWAAHQRNTVRDRIDTERCICTHGCDMTVNTLFAPRTVPRVALRLARTVLRTR